MAADIVFLNGEVITVDKENRIVEAVAVTGNRIVAVGKNEEMNHLITNQTKVVDLQGKSLLPGFIDSHLHITMYGTNKLAVSCKEPYMNSIEDILKELRVKAQTTPKGQWVRAWGFNETAVAEKRYPTREELDEVSTEHPIMVLRTCGHISVINSKALETINIDESTPDPDGGTIERDHQGVLTGRLIETAHMRVFEEAKYTDEELRKAMSLASDDFLAMGITSIHDAGGYGPDNFRVMQQAVRSRNIRVRVYSMVCALNHSEEFVDKMIQAGVTTGLGDEWFKIGPAKIFTDGSSSGPTIATRKPYTSNPEDYGVLYYRQEEINRILGEAHKKGFQITAHAQGDRAIEMVLNSIEQALQEYPRENHRHRIEHAGITEPDLQERMKELEIVPIPNPPFFYEFGDGYLKNYGERVNYMYPVRNFIDRGIIAAASSDSPVTDCNPLLGIHVAVNRRSKLGQEVGSNQRIDVLEAIKLYTWNGAYASFEEDIKGSIEVGKLADFVVINSSILSTEESKIKDLSVEITVLDGKTVYQKAECVL